MHAKVTLLDGRFTTIEIVETKSTADLRHTEYRTATGQVFDVDNETGKAVVLFHGKAVALGGFCII